MAKIDVKKLKAMGKDDWKELLLSNLDVLFIVGQVVLLVVLFQMKMKDDNVKVQIPHVATNSDVEKILPNDEYNQLIRSIDYDYTKSEFAGMGTKNMFDFKFVKDPEKLQEEVLALEAEAKTLFGLKKYDFALEKINETLLRSPYRDSAINLKKQIEEAKKSAEKK